MTRALPALLVCLLAAVPAGAQAPLTPEAFAERLDYYIRDGGEWRSANPDFKPGSGQPAAFGYQWRWTIPKRAAELRIFGLLEDGRRADYWTIAVGWHPVDARAEMFQVGAGGAIAHGAMTWETEGANEIRLRFVMPDGEIWSFHETDTRRGPDSFESVSRRFTKGQWEVQRQAVWTRIRPPGPPN